MRRISALKPENKCNKIIEENFPNLKKDMPIKVKETYRTPNRLEQKKKFPCHIIIKTLNMKKKERIVKVIYEKGQVAYNLRPIKITLNFSIVTSNARRRAAGWWWHIPLIPALRRQRQR